MPKHAHCSSCGAAYPAGAGWPRTCAACGDVTYRNPLPVAVLVQPVDDGVLLIRRAGGRLALPGGFIDHGESWQAAAARELREEAHLAIDPAGVALFAVRSAPDGTLLVFGIARPIGEASLPPFVVTDETTERVVARAPIELAFPLHTEVLREYFVVSPSSCR